MVDIVVLQEKARRLIKDGAGVDQERKKAAGLSIVDSEGPVTAAPGPSSPPPRFQGPQGPNITGE